MPVVNAELPPKRGPSPAEICLRGVFAFLFPGEASGVERCSVLVDGNGRNYMVHASRRDAAGKAEIHSLDTDIIYVRYVSDDTIYGGDLSLWPATFSRYVEAWLASRICIKLTQSQSKKDSLERDAETWLTKAKSIDAMDEPTKFLPAGSWSSARHTGGGRRDRGSRGRLTG